MIPKIYDHLVPKKCTDKFKSINITPVDINDKYQYASFELHEATDKPMRKTAANILAASNPQINSGFLNS